MSVKVMGAVWELNLPHEKALILLALADHADHEGGHVYPAVGFVAWKTGYSVRQVQRIMEALRVDGVLIVEREATPNAPAQYRIDLSGVERKPPYVRGAKTSPPRRGDPAKMSPRITTFPAGRGDTAMSPEPSLEPSLEPSDPPNGGTPARGQKPSLTPLYDALRAQGIKAPGARGREIAAAQTLLTSWEPEQIAACWADIAQGRYGDEFSRRELSFGYLAGNNRLHNWQAWIDRGRPALRPVAAARKLSGGDALTAGFAREEEDFIHHATNATRNRSDYGPA